MSPTDLVEVHETYEKEGARMGMRRVEKVPVPANSTTSFKPMGHHVMLIKLSEDLHVGDTVAAVLNFKIAGEKKIRNSYFRILKAKNSRNCFMVDEKSTYLNYGDALPYKRTISALHSKHIKILLSLNIT